MISSSKFNPIRTCSCFQCRNSGKRRHYLTSANRKFRHLSKVKLKTLLDDDEFLDLRIAAGYTD